VSYCIERFFFFCFHQLLSELAEQNLTKTGHMLRTSELTAIWKCLSEMWGIPSSCWWSGKRGINRGPKNCLFSTTSRLSG